MSLIHAKKIFFKKELETFISTSRSVIPHHWALDWYWWGQTRANEARQQQKRTHLLFDAVKWKVWKNKPLLMDSISNHPHSDGALVMGCSLDNLEKIYFLLTQNTLGVKQSSQAGNIKSMYTIQRRIFLFTTRSWQSQTILTTILRSVSLLKPGNSWHKSPDPTGRQLCSNLLTSPCRTLECQFRPFPQPDNRPYIIRTITFGE